ncbi:acyl-CoA dehydrogenase family protein [Thermoflavimicrobium daqui]|uniref:Acyl-CoA dehydrogenase n=1 Tax=Thermoflavimicrobium daqui TaxID=2137476 RepID=A0A364K677_9BACL|nr:acyl-CoA dehydrogenase [Thermoflavimicrobium daqui]
MNNDLGNATALLEKARALSERFAQRAAEVDEKADFPEKNFKDLKEAGFLELTIPKEFGGHEITLSELVRVIEYLGEGDASTALSLGWHLSILMEQATLRQWPQDQFADICHEIITQKKLINRIATEPTTGSPSRGGNPQTIAQRTMKGWEITGYKTFASMSKALDFLLVTATIKETGEVAEFLIRKGLPGVFYEETWNTLGMRGTISHDIRLKNVVLPEESLLRIMPEKQKRSYGRGWMLHIPACYLGVAKAARRFAVQFAKDYSPYGISGSIQQFPHIQRFIGEMEVEYFTAQTLLYSMAERWDHDPQQRLHLAPELAATKLVVTNTACHIVDLAMRIVGGHSLYRRFPLERYYRDVRGGLHNPPMDDMTIQMLAQRAFEQRDK